MKNVNEVDRNQPTWGHLIRTYNDRAQGNVEQFSICSDDSIWSEPEQHPEHDLMDHEHGAISSETEYQRDSDSSSTSKDKFDNNNYKVEAIADETKSITSPILLSKWLESAARFQPSETNYSWWVEERRRRLEPKVQRITVNTLRHDRDEVEAAVALTALATASSRITAP